MKWAFYLLFLVTLIFFNASHCKAQISIAGRVFDQDGKKLKGILVTLTNKQDIVLTFSNTDSLGYYSFTLTNANTKDSLFIQIYELGYVKVRFAITGYNQKIDFKLVSESNAINDVIVYSSKPLVIQKGDTLRYNVDSFSTKQDRTILDVIKKLPGIDVLETGEIKFQGKSINALYVDGDNLVDGKYNKITKSLPNDIAASIEVLRNHQPIQALQGIQFSDAPGLNIVLKNKSRMKLILEGTVGVGEPGLYEGKLNTMTFRKSFKILNTFKMLNTGKDLKQDFVSHFRSDPDLQNDRNLLNSEFGLAPLSPDRTLLNKDFSEDLNVLIKTKNNFDLRLNLSYLNSKLTTNKMADQYFILPTDTINYSESIQISFRESLFRIGLNALSNKKSSYFNNNLQLEITNGFTESNMYASATGSFTESLQSKKLFITNLTRYFKTLTPKLIFEAYSFMYYKQIPQENRILPGLYEVILNNNQPYEQLKQEGQTAGFSSRNYVSIKIPSVITTSFNAGVDLHDQSLRSDLNKIMTGISFPIADSFTNKITWYRTRVYGAFSLNKNSGSTNFELSVPIEKNWINYDYTNILERKQFLFIQPSVKVRTKFGKQGFLNANTSHNRAIGSYYDIYKGYILNGYRSFTSKGGVLPVTKNTLFSLSYELNNIPRFLFITSAFSLNHTVSNVLPVFMLSTLSTTIINQEFSNSTNGYSFNLSLAKYFRAVKTLFTFQPSFSSNQFNQFQNGFLLSYLNNSWNWTIKTSSNISSIFNFNYITTFTTFINKPKERKLDPISQRSNTVFHKVNLNISLHSTLQFTSEVEYYRNSRTASNQVNSIKFIDVGLTYKPKNSTIDLQLAMRNILNEQTYSIINNSSNAFNQASFLIRPRNTVVSLNYRF